MRRRSFFLAAAASGLPVSVPAFAQERPQGRLKIAAVEIWKLDGHRSAVSGINHQYQVNALHVYDELRPRPYKDSPNPQPGTVPTSAFYLTIRTDAGLDGLYGPIDKEAAIVVDEQLRAFLIGKDPLAGETLWDQMYRSNRHSRHGHFMMAISAVDNTLWDLRGRYFKTPVHRLLGGPTRAEVNLYGSCLGYSLEPEAVRTRALKVKEQGFQAQKWFLAYGPGAGAEGMRQNVELVKTLRETLGEDYPIMFDSYQGWDLNYAIEWAKQVEKYRPHWIEESFATEKVESYAELRRKTSIPVASGEHIYGRWEVHEYLKAGALDILQADPEWTGGVSELSKICAVASLFDVQLIPHGHSLHTALHVIASQSPMTCPMAEYLITKMESYHHFEKEPPAVVSGRVAVPQKPGFGIELDPAKVEKKTLQTWV